MKKVQVLLLLEKNEKIKKNKMNYKILFILLLFTISFSINAQSTQELNLKPFRLQFTFLNESHSNIVFNFDSSAINKNTFSVYNKVLKTNDYYSNSSSKVEFISSKTLEENDFRVYKIDSFNPYGAESFNKAIVLGVINIFLDKL